MSSVEGGESGVGTTESETESGSQTANRDESKPAFMTGSPRDSERISFSPHTVISKYIYQAKKRREQSVSSARRDSKKPKLDQHSQWMVSQYHRTN